MVKQEDGKEESQDSKHQEKRTNIIKVRFDDHEMERLKLKASRFGRSLGAFLREIGLGNGQEIKPMKRLERWGNLGILGNELLELKDKITKVYEKDEVPDIFTRLIEKLDEAVEEIKGLRSVLENDSNLEES